MTKAMRDLGQPMVGAGLPSSRWEWTYSGPLPAGVRLPMSPQEREALLRNPQFRTEIAAAYCDPNANLGEVFARWGVRT